MPLRNDILDPIPGDNPGGQNLRYAPVYDKIKEARREDDDAPQGEWARERKVADWPLTIKLISETLALKSKDLQLAAWLTEALLRREGVAGLKEGLDLLRELLGRFWENLYPELEDGDAEFRATPVQWVGDRMEQAIKRSALTKSGLDWFQYKESRTVGYEEDASNSDKQEAREAALKDGKTSGEAFDTAFNATPKAYYVSLEGTFDGAIESVDELNTVCQDKFGDVSPTFGSLRSTLEEVRQTVHILLLKKREKEPDAGQAPVAVDEEEPAKSEPSREERMYAEASRVQGSTAAAPARAPVRRATGGAEPADREDANGRVIAVAKYLRREEPYSPAPYLLLRGLRWGELRANGDSIDAALLEAPPTEVRQELKRLANEGSWTEVLEAAETAMGEPYGRGWLDLQRYVCRACYELGSYYDPIQSSVKSALRALLVDLPSLRDMTLADDTPVANPETATWIKDEVGAAPAAQAMQEMPSMDDDRPAAEPGEELPPDAFQMAMQAVQSGSAAEGIQILTREMAQERSSRARFSRKVQLAQLCLSSGYDTVAHPLLLDLAAEIERRKLEDWEAAEVVAHPLVLLYRCLGKMEGTEEEKRKLYARICCLDPVQALACG